MSIHSSIIFSVIICLYLHNKILLLMKCYYGSILVHCLIDLEDDLGSVYSIGLSLKFEFYYRKFFSESVTFYICYSKFFFFT